MARSLVGTVDLERTFVIGDTPADIACGISIGARTIAVATGPYSLEALRRSSPSLLFSELPEPKRFAEAIGVAR
jgi:phosphoglycolate phosphatase